ncbi:MAG: RES family NAD+ phosphorylase [Winogradskyella sp.]
MKVYRIAKQNFINDLSGEGARLFGGRWNKRGFNVLYTSQHLSLSVLELLVHIDMKFVKEDFRFIEIDLPDDIKQSKLPTSILKKEWRHNPPLSFTQDYGSEWLQQNKSLLLKIPSAVLPNEFNYLINPNHKDFSKVKIVKKGFLDLDQRVLK